MIECFMVHPKGGGYVALRRYSYKECPGAKKYHDATAHTGEIAPITRDPATASKNITPAIWYDGHAKWPKKCAECSYVFDLHPPRADGVSDVSGYDLWQVTIDEIWEASDGRQWLFDDLPPGAMYDAFWTGWRGDDGIALAVVLPGGQQWYVDAPASDGTRHWTRTGVPPVVSATPAVQVAGWHGHLTHGHLADTTEFAHQEHPAGKG